MQTGWRYRIASAGGALLLTVLAVVLAANGTVQSVARLVPVLGLLPFDPASGRELLFETATTLAVVFAAFLPLPLMLAVLSAGFVLAGAVDVTVFSRTGPRWYVRLRIALTLVVVVVLAITASVASGERTLIESGALLSSG